MTILEQVCSLCDGGVIPHKFGIKAPHLDTKFLTEGTNLFHVGLGTSRFVEATIFPIKQGANMLCFVTQKSGYSFQPYPS